VSRVITKGGLRLECDFVVAGIGIEPVVDVLDGTGIHVDNGVVVDQYCQTSVPGIYAAGDVANHYHPVFERQMRVEHWYNAIKQGAAAARNMLGKAVPYDEIHWFWSDQYDANLQYGGHHTKWEQLVVRGRLDSGSFLAFYINNGRIDAVAGLNRAKDVRRSIPLIKARRELNLGQLQDESIDLRSLTAQRVTDGSKA
jgi:3-phenylpropionate/trans-cinnamate dioxygenase ferredoxin reductase subunit